MRHRKHLQKLALALVAACSVYAIVLAGSRWLKEWTPIEHFFGHGVEQASDVRSRLFSDFRVPGPRTVPIVVLDLDQATHVALGRPPITPASVAAKLLRQAVEARPALVIVDIDLSWPRPEEDAKLLQEALRDFAAGPTPILLLQISSASGQTGAPRQFHRSTLDDIVASSRSLFWVSGGALDSGDRVVRRVPLWFDGCKGDEPVVLPNAAFAGWLVLRLGKDEARKVLDRELPKPPWSCPEGRASSVPAHANPTVTVDGTVHVLANRSPSDAFQYDMAWTLKPGKLRPTVRLADGRLVDVLTVLPAGPMLKAADPPAADLFRGRVVILGSSAEDHRDVHLTPLGEMPGALIIANQLRSLLERGPTGAEDPWSGLLLTMLCTIVTFLIWLAVHHYLPTLPSIVEHLVIVGIVAFWSLVLVLLPVPITSLLFPLTQYIAYIVLLLVNPGALFPQRSAKTEVTEAVP